MSEEMGTSFNGSGSLMPFSRPRGHDISSIQFMFHTPPADPMERLRKVMLRQCIDSNKWFAWATVKPDEKKSQFLTLYIDGKPWLDYEVKDDGILIRGLEPNQLHNIQYVKDLN